MVRAKYTIQNISTQTPMPKILNTSCMCLINPLYHRQHGFAQGTKLNMGLMINVYQCSMGMSLAKPNTILYIIGTNATISQKQRQAN